MTLNEGEIAKMKTHNSKEMTHVLTLYADLLGEHAKYLRDECFIGPYQSVPKAFFKSFFYVFQKKYYQAIKRYSFVHVPNILPWDLMGAELLLRRMEKLTDHELSALEECNRINIKRYSKRTAMNWFSKASLFLIGIVGLLTGAGKAIDVESLRSFLAHYFVLYAPFIGGLVLGSILNIIISLPNLGLLNAFGDIISLAKAYRLRETNTKAPDDSLDQE